MNKEVGKENLNRYLYLDFLKIIAIYLVMFNHTGTRGFFLFSVSQDSKLYFLYLLISIIDKIAVPLFLMTSGVLLLGKRETIGELMRKRVLRYVVVLVLFSFFQYLWSLGFNVETLKHISISDFLTKLYSYPYAATYWYLYAYLGFLLMLPFLRKIATNMHKKDVYYLLALRIFLTAVLPIFQYLVWKGEVSYYYEFDLRIVTEDVIFYPIMGYCIHNHISETPLGKKEMNLLLAGSILSLVISAVMTHYRCIITGDWTVANNQIFHGLFIYIVTIYVFILAQQMSVKRVVSERTSRLIQKIGSTTLGIMLLEAFIQSRTEACFLFLEPYLGSMIACMIHIALCLVIGLAATLVMKKIPLLRKLV